MLRTTFALLADLARLVPLAFRCRAELAADNLFRRKQLGCYLERQVRPHRTDNASLIALVALSPLIEWRDLLTIVRPETLVRWHRGEAVSIPFDEFVGRTDSARDLVLGLRHRSSAESGMLAFVHQILGTPQLS